MTWRVAKSLDKLLAQFNARYPNRSKVSDGGIGDAAHATRDSDHNPWFSINGVGIVSARDFTHDPANGMDIDRLTDELAASRDPRIKYIIANGLILDSRPGNNPWTWTKYTGSNAHTKHFHLSVMPEYSDDDRNWNLPSFGNVPTTEPGGLESMAMNTVWRDSYGNNQTVQGFMSETQRDLNETKDAVDKLAAAVLGRRQSRIPGDKNMTTSSDLWFDAGSWTNQTLGRVVSLETKVASVEKQLSEILTLLKAKG